MSCPFLTEAEVKYCGASPARKLIVQNGEAPADEKCSSGAHAKCTVYAQRAAGEEAPGSTTACPFLEHASVQYCKAAPLPKMVPYSESVQARCGSDDCRYCEVYLSLAGAGGRHVPAPQHSSTARHAEYSVAGVQVPGWLWYSPNHMWLDRGASGFCHIGIDDFFARMLARADSVNFLTLAGFHRPSAVVAARGVEVQFVFPRQLLITDTNCYLRANPSRLISHPYTLGWLFKGLEQVGLGSDPPAPSRPTLRTGPEVADWMRSEIDRAVELMGQRSALPRSLSSDGGCFQGDALNSLGHDALVAMFRQFLPASKM